MRKAVRISAIKSARSYTFIEAAKLLNVSVDSLRNWVRGGLPVLKTERPFLIIGKDLKDWLTARNEKRRVALGPHQFFCLRCKKAQTPYGGMVDCLAQTSQTWRLMAICVCCGGGMNRIVSVRDLPEMQRIFDVQINER